MTTDMNIKTTQKTSGTVPIPETITKIGKGFPDKLVIFKIPSSRYWWVRYYTEGKILKKSTKTEDKRKGIEFGKKFYEQILIRQHNLLPLGSSDDEANLQQDHHGSKQHARNPLDGQKVPQHFHKSRM